MTRLFNDPTEFADEFAEGFVAANRHLVRAVPGGVIRATEIPAGQVVVITGGGSGHYPAFGGLVGQGLAHGAALGNIFASPSAQQVYSVAKAAESGGGVLFSYGNYAGDVLNFDAAQDRLRAEGIACETVTVTDDISSAPAAERDRRRGVAGGLCVYKIAAAAAETGLDLAEVVRVAQAANARIRSVGVAFAGCTLPGAGAPLFEVPAGRMAVGLGIHGEPGLSETEVPTADGLAELMVGDLLAELPEGLAAPAGARVVPVLNGLGSVKYEELYVVYRRVARLLEDAGAEIVDPQVGEFCTSLDMAGASLTLLWLDDELEPLWTAPADTPTYKKGSVTRAAVVVEDVATGAASADVPPASEESRAAAVIIDAALDAVRTVLDEAADELGRLDAIAGDGDHGIGMQRGARAGRTAAAEALAAGAGAGTVLTRAADAWSDRAGGTSGALWGVALRALGERLADAKRPSAHSVVDAVGAARDGIIGYGKAEVGDKTMVDALVPFAETLAAAVDGGATLAVGWRRAAESAVAAAAATADLLPRKGRARPHAEKSLGTPDPGAHSFGLIVRTVADVLDTAAAE
ncbi:dihydroxyacetone kinase family protein [Microlunatus speluncae]|uniref:dihydroxyacetone kinase family protein n=1 Tax=Microlunatus speluncae TaxID=2594267 RepID=UPI0012662109|nr:dihydroxyacetone kinase family protein [Microlunatus speluncae]